MTLVELRYDLLFNLFLTELHQAFFIYSAMLSSHLLLNMTLEFLY